MTFRITRSYHAVCANGVHTENALDVLVHSGSHCQEVYFSENAT
jgi:hypothetical protein